MNMKAYEKDLPYSYRPIREINLGEDVRDTPLKMIFIFLPFATVCLIGWLNRPLTIVPLLLNLAAMALGIPVYIALHECLHGLVFRLLTGQKAEFGVRPSGVYCRIPECYVYRMAELLCVSAPLTVLGILSLIAACVSLTAGTSWFPAAGFLLSLNLFCSRSDIFLLGEISQYGPSVLVHEDQEGIVRLYGPSR